MEIKFLLGSGATMPTKRDNDAGFDIYTDRVFMNDMCGHYSIPAHETRMIPTGIKAKIDDGYMVILEERGSTGSIGMKRSCGIIDSNYLGEWFVALTNANDHDIILVNDFNFNDGAWQEEVKSHYRGQNKKMPVFYNSEKAIVQGIVLEIPKATLTTISEDEFNLLQTDRGAGKLGSSNK